MYYITENEKVFCIEEKSCSQFLSVGEKIMKDSTKMLIDLGIYGVVAGVTGYAGVKIATPYLRTTLKEEKGSNKKQTFKASLLGVGIGLVAAATGLTISDKVIESIENSSNKQPLITSKDE
jgi:hypothetical protein